MTRWIAVLLALLAGTGEVQAQQVPFTFDAGVGLIDKGQVNSNFSNLNTRLNAPFLTTGATTPQTLADKTGETRSVVSFGAIGDGAADDTAAITAAFAYALSTAGNCAATFLPKAGGTGGAYKVTSDIIVDIGPAAANCKSDGLKIVIPDAGMDIDGRTLTTTPTLEFRCTGQANGCNNLIITGGRLTIKGANAGPVMVIGASDLSDQFVGGSIDYIIPQNYSANAAAAGLQVNKVSGGFKLRVWGAVNSGGGGTSGYGVQLNSSSGGDYDINSNWGTSAKALHLTNGSIVGNRIKLSCTGGGQIGLTIDTASALNNSIFGNFAGCTTGVAATAGGGNLLVNPYWVGVSTKYSGSIGVAETDTTFPYTSANPSTGGTVNMTSPQVTPIETVELVQAADIATLTVNLPTCNLANDQFIAGFGTQFAVAGLTVGAQTTGAVVGYPLVLNRGQGQLFQCRGGEGIWRPIAGAGSGLPARTLVSTLPTCGASQLGLGIVVTDATAPTYGGALTGGGAVVTPAFCTGAAWVSH